MPCHGRTRAVEAGRGESLAEFEPLQPYAHARFKKYFVPEHFVLAYCSVPDIVPGTE
jgi:hypothetical protein